MVLKHKSFPERLDKKKNIKQKLGDQACSQRNQGQKWSYFNGTESDSKISAFLLNISLPFLFSSCVCHSSHLSSSYDLLPRFVLLSM